MNDLELVPTQNKQKYSFLPHIQLFSPVKGRNPQAMGCVSTKIFGCSPWIFFPFWIVEEQML